MSRLPCWSRPADASASPRVAPPGGAAPARPRRSPGDVKPAPPCAIVVPEPLSVPPDKLDRPETVSVPEPFSDPPDWVSVATDAFGVVRPRLPELLNTPLPRLESVPARVAVPPLIVVVPDTL